MVRHGAVRHDVAGSGMAKNNTPDRWVDADNYKVHQSEAIPSQVHQQLQRTDGYKRPDTKSIPFF